MEEEKREYFLEVLSRLPLFETKYGTKIGSLRRWQWALMQGNTAHPVHSLHFDRLLSNHRPSGGSFNHPQPSSQKPVQRLRVY